MNEDIRIISIEIQNCRCIPNATLRFDKPEPGKGQFISIIAGNGGGKSSLLDGIRSIFVGGSKPNLIRDGEDKMTATMLLSDTWQVKRLQTRGLKHRSYLEITSDNADGEMKAPQTYVETLAAGYGFDPVKLCQAKGADRLAYLLTIVPLEFTPDEIVAAMKHLPPLCGPGISANDSFNLDQFNKLCRDLVEKRAQIGSKRDHEAKSGEALRRSLAAADNGEKPVDWKAELARLSTEEAKIRSAESADLASVNSQLAEARKLFTATIRSAEDIALEEWQGLLKIARTPGLAEGTKISHATSLPVLARALSALSIQITGLAKAEKDGREAADEIKAANAASLQDLATQISAAQVRADEQIRSGAIREQMNLALGRAKALSAEWDSIKVALENLEILRREKMRDLPAGLEVKADGELYADGRPFDDLNTAAQYLKAMELGAAGPGILRLMICDEAEHLEDANWEMLKRVTIEGGYTVIAARVPSKEEVTKHGRKLRSEPSQALLVGV